MNERAISARQAWNCETAAEERCRCRCGGTLHGAARVRDRAGLAELAAGDPHFVKLETEHPLGPLRKVVDREKLSTRWPYHRGPKVKVGKWVLLLECGHRHLRKLSRRPPKQLHCDACKNGYVVGGPTPTIEPINKPRQEKITPTGASRNIGTFRSHAGRAYRTRRTATD